MSPPTDDARLRGPSYDLLKDDPNLLPLIFQLSLQSLQKGCKDTRPDRIQRGLEIEDSVLGRRYRGRESPDLIVPKEEDVEVQVFSIIEEYRRSQAH